MKNNERKKILNSTSNQTGSLKETFICLGSTEIQRQLFKKCSDYVRGYHREILNCDKII